jgi:hypothetical protein
MMVMSCWSAPNLSHLLVALLFGSHSQATRIYSLVHREHLCEGTPSDVVLLSSVSSKLNQDDWCCSLSLIHSNIFSENIFCAGRWGRGLVIRLHLGWLVSSHFNLFNDRLIAMPRDGRRNLWPAGLEVGERFLKETSAVCYESSRLNVLRQMNPSLFIDLFVFL